MKKVKITLMIVLFGSCVVLFLFWKMISLDQLWELQKMADTSMSGSLEIIRIFKDMDITYERISASEADFVSDMNGQYSAYDLIQDKRINYTIILSPEKTLSAILDKNGNLVLGLIDTAMEIPFE